MGEVAGIKGTEETSGRVLGAESESLGPPRSTRGRRLREPEAATARDRPGRRRDRLSDAQGKTYVVIPTLNEAANLGRLVDGIRLAVGEHPYHIIVVDDGSTDGTQDAVRTLAAAGHPIDLLERGRKLGIGSAIRDGLGWSLRQGDADCIVTMDGDLSHDPREILRLAAATKHADLVQGSRYAPGARVEGWTWSRRFLSLTGNALARLVLRTGMREHTTYFRAYSPHAAEAAVRTEGCDSYEWALGSLLAVRGQGMRVKEVPITFRNRRRGTSKLTAGEVFRWLRYLIEKGVDARRGAGSLTRLARFALVGASGIVINNAVLFALVGFAGLWPLAALILAIEASIVWNFHWNDRWTFRGRGNGSSPLRLLASYHVVCVLGVAVNVGLFVALVNGLGVNYLVSNLIAVLAGFATNLSGSASWTWAGR